MLKIQNLSKEYIGKKKTTIALDEVNLEIESGELLAILGLSGSGKTTLISHIGGLDIPEEGEIIYKDILTNEFNEQGWSDYRLNHIGFVFQDFYLIKHLTARENVELAMSLSGKDKEHKEKRALELLEQVGLSDCIHQYPNELSGGQKQRVAIARALANRPNIILADEPTGALDPKSSRQILDLLKNLAKQGHTVIIVTHDDVLAEQYATRIVEIDEGKIISDRHKSERFNGTIEKNDNEKSSLQLGTAFKIAANNLSIRKKSTIFSLVSLIPGMVIIFFLMNFIFNLAGYKIELNPVINDILPNEKVMFLTPFNDETLDEQVRNAYRDIKRKVYDPDEINELKDRILEPYDEEEIKEIENIEGVDAVIPTLIFGTTIDEKDFSIITLPPKAYAKYQNYIDPALYPEDDDQGVILYEPAIEKLYGKYNDDFSSFLDTPLTINIWSKNAVRANENGIAGENNVVKADIIRLINKEPLTTFMKKYYEGYIFVPYNYGKEISAQFSNQQFTMISTTKEDFTVTKGPLLMEDQLLPLRNKTFLQDQFDLFQVKEFSTSMPSNNFTVKTMIITNDLLSQESERLIRSHGFLEESRYDQQTVSSMIESEKMIDYGIYLASGVSGVMIFIPALLICLILYISILIRINEIGIIKAIGGRRIDIVVIFLLEAVIVAVISAVIANILFIPVLQSAQSMLEDTYRISFELGSNPVRFNLLGLIAGNIVGILIVSLMSLLPGLKASKLPPNILLKHVS